MIILALKTSLNDNKYNLNDDLKANFKDLNAISSITSPLNYNNLE
jgi:hypothetical protein